MEPGEGLGMALEDQATCPLESASHCPHPVLSRAAVFQVSKLQRVFPTLISAQPQPVSTFLSVGQRSQLNYRGKKAFYPWVPKSQQYIGKGTQDAPSRPHRLYVPI